MLQCSGLNLLKMAIAIFLVHMFLLEFEQGFVAVGMNGM